MEPRLNAREVQHLQPMETRDSPSNCKRGVPAQLTSWGQHHEVDNPYAGELRSGSWGFTNAEIDDVLEVPPEQLWGRLINQPGRLHWLRH